MHNGLYGKLAGDNIKRNAQTYVPYILTCILTTAMLYIIRSLALNEGLEQMSGGAVLQAILAFGSHITRIFAFIFLFYTNSFLMKRRKKEFGLFNILGMEKRHIARVLFLESVYTTVVSLAAGFAAGILLDKLLFLVLTKMLGGNVKLGFYISTDSMIVTAVFMVLTFLMIYLNALRQIHLAKPVELLHGSEVGEKEPKAKWLLAILGVVLIGAGYYISIVTKNPLQALTLFFIAVVCVILGTYCLFTAGSIALLKLLKKNKSYYYQINHFTTVSGMMYRMKQNAVGLANICILSTMVLVMISTTSCLLAGMEDIINTRYPYAFEVYSVDKAMPDAVEQYLADNHADVKQSKTYTSLTFTVKREENRFYIPDNYSMEMSGICEFGIITAADYNRLTGETVELTEDSILLWSGDQKIDFAEAVILDRTYSVAQRLTDFPIPTMDVVDTVCIVVQDAAVMQELYEKQQAIYGEMASSIRYYYHFDIGEGDEETLFRAMYSHFKESELSVGIDAKYDAHEDFMSLYGGLFFLGVFLGTLFMMQTILIIYYKQISEGFDDQKRFAIMQNVGMSRAEVRKTIHTQIITVFFLPLLTAGLHTGFSFPLISRIMIMFHMTNTPLFILCLLICFAAFALIYALIYGVTARTYYKIVSK